MRLMALRLCLPASLLLVSSVQAAPIYSDVLVNCAAQTTAAQGKSWGGEFYNWFGTATSDTATLAAKALTNRTNGATDLTLSMPNFGGFVNPDRGNGVNYTFDGFTFYGGLNTATEPYNPMQTYLADNMAATGTRDGLMVFRITSPEQYHFRITVVGSYHNATDGTNPATGQPDGVNALANIGGTYVTTRTSPFVGSFTGGTTASYDPQGEGTLDRGGTVVSGNSVWNAGLNSWVLDLQIGVGSAGNFVNVNALRIQTSAIPEPTMIGFAGIVSATLAMRRRRGN